MKRLLVALQFLTILPVKVASGISKEEMGASLACFPLVGALVGALTAGVLYIFGFMPHMVTVALALIASIALTGAIHLDGLADTCDGLFSGRPKDKMLEIMRDSRIGTMGVASVVCLLLLKFTILISIPNDVLWRVWIAAIAFGRWSQCLACYISPYAREDGKAKNFIEHAGVREIVYATIFMLILTALLLGLKGVILFGLALASVFILIHFIRTRIGGMTGDTIGATSEVSELLILFMALAYL